MNMSGQIQLRCQERQSMKLSMLYEDYVSITQKHVTSNHIFKKDQHIFKKLDIIIKRDFYPYQ